MWWRTPWRASKRLAQLDDGRGHAHPRWVSRRSALPTQRYATFQAPVLAYSIDDDPEATRESVDAMMAAYPNVERRHLAPADIGLDQVGHFGYFKSSAQPFWGEAISWLKQQPHRSTPAT